MGKCNMMQILFTLAPTIAEAWLLSELFLFRTSSYLDSLCLVIHSEIRGRILWAIWLIVQEMRMAIQSITHCTVKHNCRELYVSLSFIADALPLNCNMGNGQGLSNNFSCQPQSLYPFVHINGACG